MKKSESFWQRLRALDEVSWDNPLDAQLTAAATDEPDSELRRRAPMEFAIAEARHDLAIDMYLFICLRTP